MIKLACQDINLSSLITKNYKNNTNVLCILSVLEISSEMKTSLYSVPQKRLNSCKATLSHMHIAAMHVNSCG